MSEFEETRVREDLSPIDPTAAKETLERKLELRPERQDLVDRHILENSTLAPALQAQAKELERQRLADRLEHKIKDRPTQQGLVERHILEDSKLAPSLQAAQKELERSRLENALENKLKDRPSPEELLKRGYIEGDEGKN